MRKQDKLRVPEYLQHIIEAIYFVETYVKDEDFPMLAQQVKAVLDHDYPSN